MLMIINLHELHNFIREKIKELHVFGNKKTPIGGFGSF